MKTIFAQNSINKLFQHKGKIAPIAEKANINFKLKSNNPNGLSEDFIKSRLHYFSIGHSFKQIDTKQVFGQTDEGERKFFKNLQLENFPNKDTFKTLINDLRNINSHYIHDFEKIKIEKIEPLKHFLIEAFSLAIKMSYLKLETSKKASFVYSDITDNNLMHFLSDKFFPNHEFQIEERAYFKKLSYDKALEYLLFIELDEHYDWKNYKESNHVVFTIAKGTYLSFYGSLFCLSMFLYRGEARTMISKIKGFKKNATEDERVKLDIFTFFAKKFSSQDADAEEKHLVKFRDIVQYLNQYPTAWNKELELESSVPKMTEALNKELELTSSVPKMTEALTEYVKEEEIQRCYEDMYAVGNFKEYALHYFWQRPKPSINAKTEKDFLYEIQTPESVKKLEEEIRKLESDLKKKYDYEKEKALKSANFSLKKLKEKNLPNTKLLKLQKRIANHSLIRSYGRNIDRFMEMGLRYLAENQCFGEYTQFRLYKYFSPEDERLKPEEKHLTKKEFDKLKYHEGKLTHFTTYQEHINKYQDWDMPFVIENNATQIRFSVGGDFYTVSIQRNLLVYLLEIAFYSSQITCHKVLQEYILQNLMDKKESVSLLNTNTPFSKIELAKLRKLIPSRVIQDKLHLPNERKSDYENYTLILDQATIQEIRYQALVEKAKKDNVLEFFLKRNKGKNFKLRFVKKAWNLLFFKNAYVAQLEENKNKHHKHYHITKDEFDNFCKWMYAFEEIPFYKLELEKLLNQKGFLNNVEFKNIFDIGKSLDDYYTSTKKLYTNWLETNKVAAESSKQLFEIHKYKNYEEPNKHLLYINTSHFIEFLKSKKWLQLTDSKIVYTSLNNAKYLRTPYYYTDILQKEEYKTHANLFNKLRTHRLEDCLLFEIGQRYISKNLSKANKIESVKILLSSAYDFEIKPKDNFSASYYINIPFNKIDAFSEWNHAKNQGETGKYDVHFLSKLPLYLENYGYMLGNKSSIAQKWKTQNHPKTIDYADLNTVNMHIMNTAATFTEIGIEMERYLIEKYTLKLKSYNIDVKDITDYDKYFYFIQNAKKEKIYPDRNNAFHFNIASKPYKFLLEDVHKKFIIEKIKTKQYDNFDAVPPIEKTILKMFLKELFDHCYDRNNKAKTEIEKRRKLEDAINKYWQKEVKKYLI
ncbi:MAG: hypothetical protein EAZ53_14510 [Bacteroidetes bacterium]|nr:MAG: hypothetical protein EAZ53_14510 [Bacteroidota bacterium]